MSKSRTGKSRTGKKYTREEKMTMMMKEMTEYWDKEDILEYLADVLRDNPKELDIFCELRDWTEGGEK